MASRRYGTEADSDHSQTSLESSNISHKAQETPAPLLSKQDTPPKETDPSKPVTFEDGGLIAWLQVVASFFAFFNTWGVVSTFGTFQTTYELSILSNRSSSDISWIGSLQAFLLLAGTIVTGPLFDKGYCTWLLVVGSALSIFGLFMTSIAKEYWQFILAQGICMGLGFSAVFISSVTVIPTYFSKRRALAIGIGATGSSIGGIIYPIIFHELEPKLGFGWTTRILAFIMLATSAITVATTKVKALPPVSRKFWDTQAFKSPSFLIFTAAAFTGYLGLYIPQFYAQLFAIQRAHASLNLAFYMLPIFNAGSIIGRVVPGFIADRFGGINTIVGCMIPTVILAWSWIAVHNIGGTIPWEFLFGACSGAFVSLQPACLIRITMKDRDLRFLGTWMGMNLTIGSFGLLIGNPIAGVALGDTLNWLALQCFTGAAVTVSLTCLTATGVVLRRA